MKTDEKGYLKWKLKEQPTVKTVNELYVSGLLTKEEARKIILEQTDDIRQTDIEDIKDEIKLLRKLVLEISAKTPQTQIIKIIETGIQNVPYKWTEPYYTYCSSRDRNGDYPTGITGSNTTLKIE